jgi:GNAT superfamily N-acetyltransferase
MTLTIKALSPALLEDYFTFFDSVAFVENPDWSGCYCYSFHFTGPAALWTPENNRAAVRKLVREGKMGGCLAFLDSRVVGWCNANQRLRFQRLPMMFELEDQEDPGIFSIVCFVIHQDFRKQGIATSLLEHVIERCRSGPWHTLEAYPGKGTRSCEGHYMGPPEMYLSHGFQVEREYRDHSLVRLNLEKDP